MKSYSKFVVTSLLILPLTLLSGFGHQVNAQSPVEPSATESSAKKINREPLNLSVSPVTLVLETEPGSTSKTQLRIRNNSGHAEQLTLRLGSFQADETGDNARLIDPVPDTEFLNWLTVSEQTFEVGSNEWKTLDVTFSPPETAALSYYYTLYIQRAEQPSGPLGEARVEGAVAILILTTVPSPQARQELQLKKFDVRSVFSEFLPQTFSLDIENTGNVHVMPQGNIFIDGQNQKDLAVLTINPNGNVVLPQSKRTFNVEWNDGFPVRESEVGNRLIWNWQDFSHFRFGKYTAHVVLVYDNGERDVPIESFVSFWIIPWRIIALALAIPLLPALLVFFLMKWRYGKSD